MYKPRILVVEDDPAISNLIRTTLETQEYQFHTAQNGSGALMEAVSYNPDVVILDLGLPDIDGQKVLSTVRSWTQTPVIVVSARSHERDKVESLDLGADDYITKPFGSAELLARIRTSLRHSTRMNTSSDQLFHPYKCGELILDFEKRTLTISGNIVHLTPISFQITYFLIK